MKKKILLSVLLTFIGLSIPSFAQYTKLLDFAGATSGRYPTYGSLISDGTFLYGMNYSGGTNGGGTIFKMKPDGSNYIKLLDFAGATNGKNPYGGLLYDGIFLYGVTAYGGINAKGTIFKIKPDGSNYMKLLDFAGTTNGKNPYGNLISDGTFLYGMTGYGGINSCGTIFKIKPDGSNYAKLLDFDGATNGNSPFGSLVSDGTFLYGMTDGGGANFLGTVFKIKPDGSNFVKLLDFDGITNGQHPYGGLISDGIFLYGMTSDEAINADGTIFKIKPDGSNYIKLFDFSATTSGRHPYGDLLYDGISLYGTTCIGGTNDQGTVFEIKPDGTGYSKLFDFDSINGYRPGGSVISDGTFLYGMTAYGGTSNEGVVFKYGLTVTKIRETNIKSELEISPNPSSGIFTLIVNNTKQSQIEIYNISGEIIYKSIFSNSKSEIDLTKEPKGIYFIRLTQDNKIIKTEKLVIKD